MDMDTDTEVAQSPPPSGTPHLDAAPVSPTGEKREISVSNDEAEDSSILMPPSKKPRLGPQDMGRVAEIVLVLSAMGSMRGGKDPTEVELALMAEAREKLALICETLAPKDIVAADAIERVIEDLGLNSRDQRPGFKVPKLSIGEKLLFTKRKMEDAKKYPSHAPTYTSPPPQGSFASGTENRGGVQLRFQSDKLSQPSVSSGGIPPASSLGSVSGGNSGSITYHFGPPSESRTSTVPSVLTSSHLAKDSSPLVVPKVERTQVVAEGTSAGSSRASIVQASSSINLPSVSAPTWSVQTKSTSLTNLRPENNITNQTPGKVQEATNFDTSLSSQAARDMTPRPYITKTASGNSSALQHQPPQSVLAAPPSNYGNHSEIAKMVQKWLPPKHPEHPSWTPPSREYMNKALTCQICQITVNDVESVLLCDACEKGYHLKCLQSQNQRGIPKVEWHCQKCLALSHGKPLPPKYGRVMRNMTTSKVTPITFGVHSSSSEKKVATADLKVNQQKVTSNETSRFQNTGAVATLDNNQVGLQLAEPRETHENNPTPMNEEKNEKLCPVDASDNIIIDTPDKIAIDAQDKITINAPDSITKTVGPSCSSTDVLPCEVTIPDMSRPESSISETRQASNLSSDLPDNESEHLSSLQNPSDNNQSQLPECAEVSIEPDENSCSTNKESEKSPAKDHTDSSAASAIKVDDTEIRPQDPIVSTENTGTTTENDVFPPDILHGFDWIGDALEIVDGKALYSSCCINGVTYKLKEHALFRSSHGKLEPSLLLGMWEDKTTGLKWVNVSRCYFPGDLPDNVGHPFTEANEVFESNHEDTFMAALISGPCEVLPPATYKEETERRSHLGVDANAGLRPIFLCKWFYDEAKGHFQPISS